MTERKVVRLTGSSGHSLFTVLAVAVLVAVTTSGAFAQGNTGTFGGPFTLDSNYQLVAGPLAGPYPKQTFSQNPYPGWVIPSNASHWINPFTFVNLGATGGPIPYTYENRFALGPAIEIEGKMAADNRLCLFANNSPVNCTLGNAAFKKYTRFTIPASSLTANAINVLDFKVTNIDLVTGLRVEYFCPPSPTGSPALYNDGPVNGAAAAWYINFGFAVSDTFTVTGVQPVTGVCLFLWAVPGSLPVSVEASVTSQEFGGTTFFAGTASLTCSLYCSSGEAINGGNCGLSINDVYACTAPLSVNLAAGTYWLNLQNAVSNTGDPVAWDEAGGVNCPGSRCPSLASENSIGTIPPESFVMF